MNFQSLISLVIFGMLWSGTYAWASTPAHTAPAPRPNCVTAVNALYTADSCGRGGSIALIPVNAQGVVNYTWFHDTTLSDSVATGLTGGDLIRVVVQDDAGCRVDTTLIVPFVPVLNVSGIVTRDTCGAGLGTATVPLDSIQGGQGPYTFLWSPNADTQTTSVAVGLDLGIYGVLVTDANGCQGTWSATVPTTRNNFDAQLSAVNPACFGDSTGQASVSISGGTGRYDVRWTSNGFDTLGIDTLLTNITIGTYTVFVSGQGPRCQYNETFTLIEPPLLTVQTIAIPTTLCNTNNGFAVALPGGGTAPYTFLWNTGSTNDTLLDVSADRYEVTVTDTNGCTATTTALVTSEPGPEFDVQILQGDNCGLGEGIARLRVTKGTPPYEVIWWTNPPQFNDTSLFAYNLQGQSSYSVLVYDADSCFNFQDFFVPGRDPLSIPQTNTTPNYCDLANGTAQVTIAGGTEPYRYQWNSNPVQNTATATNLQDGVYTVSVRDSFNCDIGTTLTVSEEVGYTIEVTHTDETCFGAEDGTATVATDGGRPPFSYEWDSEPFRQFEQTATGLPGGTVNVTVTDRDGCVRTGFANIESQDFLEAAFSFEPDTITPIALSEAFVKFNNETIGGTDYLWDFGDGNSSADFSAQHTFTEIGDYFVKLVATNAVSGCQDSVIIGPFVIIPDGTLFIPNAFSPNGDGNNDFLRIQGEALENYSLTIYDRWGGVAFSATSIADIWDGRLPGGGAAPEGVYVYILQAVAPGNQPVLEQGTITILR